MKRGEHIRVTLLLHSLTAAWKKGFEVCSHLEAAACLEGLPAIYICKLAWQSHAFHDISTGSDAIPLWLRQLSMAVGTLILTLAFIDESVLELRVQRVVVTSSEASRNARWCCPASSVS